jgi:lipopolysaccharide export system permease protein
VTGGILDRYVLRRFLVHYGLALLYLVGLFLVMDLVSRLERFLEAREALEAIGSSVAAATIGWYVASLPLILLQVAPFVTVLGACMTVVDLRRGNELYPMMEAGRSMVRVLAPVIGFAVLVTGALVLLHDRVAPAAVEARLRIEGALESREERVVTRVPHVRDARGNVWAVARWDTTHLVAEGVRVVPFRTESGVFPSLEIPRMAWERRADGTAGWYPLGARLLLPGEEPGAAELHRAVPSDRALPTTMVPADLELARASEDLEGLSSDRLRRLRDRSPELSYLTVLLHRRITYPLANLILLLVGVPLVLRGEGRSMFVPVLAALGVCASYFVADTVACDLGGRGVVPAGLATWLAPVLFGAAGAALLDAVDGPGAAR